MATFVYFIAAREFGQVKIGFSRQPLKRLQDLQTSVGCALSLLGVVEGTVASERTWHAHFASKRVRGEWFRLDDEVEALIAAAIDVTPWPEEAEALLDEDYHLGLDIADTLLETARRGFDTATVYAVLKARRQDRAECREPRSPSALYMRALGVS